MALTSRDEFLLRMYSEMWGNVNRHITLSWQPITLVVAVGAALNASFDGQIPYGVATSFGFVVTAWLLAHVFDANGWYWRNHAIIANLEFHFAGENAQNLNPFMGQLVEPGDAKLLTTLRIHFGLAIAMLIALTFLTMVAETMPVLVEGKEVNLFGTTSAAWAAIPHVVLVTCIVWVSAIARGRASQYSKVYNKSMAGRAADNDKNQS